MGRKDVWGGTHILKTLTEKRTLQWRRTGREGAGCAGFSPLFDLGLWNPRCGLSLNVIVRHSTVGGGLAQVNY